MPREIDELREEYPQGHNDIDFRKPSPLPPGDVQEAFLRWRSIAHGKAGIWKGINIVPERLLDIYEDTIGKHIIRSYFNYYHVVSDMASDKRFREYYNKGQTGSDIAFGRTIQSYFNPMPEGRYNPCIMQWQSEHIEFPYNPSDDRQSLFLQIPQFGIPSERKNKILAIIEISKYQELFVDYNLSGELDNLALTTSPVGNERKPKFQFEGSSVSKGEPTEFDFNGNTYRISSQDENIILVRVQEGEIKDKVILPRYVYYNEIVNRLFSSKTLENPADAPWEFDYSWKYSTIWDVLGIKWQRT